jgi:hypothetical protein
MHIRLIDTSGSAVSPPAMPAAPPASGLEDQVQHGLNLYLPLKSPFQMPALAEMLQTPEALKTVHAALTSLHYVHFARFLPELDGSALWVITEFDGGLETYIMDFVSVLGDVFNDILQFVRDAPPLPVQQHAREFTAYVIAQNVKIPPPWSAYPQATVIDILRATERT